MARLYGNENAPMPCVRVLRALGHDVLTALTAGLANQGVSDDAELTFADSEERVMLTNDRLDFRRLHRMEQPHCGIIEFTNDGDFKSLAYRIDAVLRDPLAVGRFYARVTKAGHTFR